MSLHYYVKKAWQDHMLGAAGRDRLAARARRARPAHQGRAGPARGRRTLRILSRRAPGYDGSIWTHRAAHAVQSKPSSRYAARFGKARVTAAVRLETFSRP